MDQRRPFRRGGCCRLIHSFGAWKLPVGLAKPTISVLRPSCASSAATTGTEPPERWKSGALPKPASSARAAGAMPGWSSGVIAGAPPWMILTSTRTVGGAIDSRCAFTERLDLAVVLVGHEARQILAAAQAGMIVLAPSPV